MAERLIRIAERQLKRGNPIPLDLASQLLAEGIDVTALERKYN